MKKAHSSLRDCARYRRLLPSSELLGYYQLPLWGKTDFFNIPLTPL